MINIIRQASSLGQALLLGTAFIVAIYFAIVLHEIAHGYAALINGDNTAKYAGRLSLNPAVHFNAIGFLMLLFVGFGFANPVPVNSANFKSYKKGMVMVSLAGVVTNLALAFLLTPLYMLVENAIGGASTAAAFYVLEWLYYFLLFAVIVNVNLAFFNILPLAPLDGFNLLASVTKPYNRVVQFLRRYSTFIILFLLLLEYVPLIGNYSPLSLYIGVCGGWVRNIFAKFWGLFGI